MNKTVTITSRNYKYANTYGGNIYQSDFNTSYEGNRNIAERIAKDLASNKKRKENIKNRKRGNEHA